MPIQLLNRPFLASRSDLVVVCDFWGKSKILWDHLGDKNHSERKIRRKPLLYFQRNFVICDRALSSWLCHLSKVGRISIFLVKMHIIKGRGKGRRRRRCLHNLIPAPRPLRGQLVKGGLGNSEDNSEGNRGNCEIN